MECTTNPFWGTGWRLDSYEWHKSMKYPGRNRLGEMLEEVRDEIRMTPLPANLSYMQMNQESTPIPQLPPYTQSTHPTSRPKVIEGAISEGDVSESMDVQETVIQKGIENKLDLVGNDAGKVTGEQINPAMSSSLNPITAKEDKDTNVDSLKGAVGGTTEHKDNEDGKTSASTSNTDLTEIDEADITSMSCDSDLLRSSFSAKSVILEDRYLDCDRMLTWALPTVNISRLRQIAAREKCASFSGKSGNPTNLATSAKGSGNVTIPSTLSRTGHPSHSTPMSHVTKRKSRKSFKVDEQTQKLEEKYNLLKMLSNIQPSE